jgi:hypothetical protein
VLELLAGESIVGLSEPQPVRKLQEGQPGLQFKPVTGASKGLPGEEHDFSPSPNKGLREPSRSHQGKLGGGMGSF